MVFPAEFHGLATFGGLGSRCRCRVLYGVFFLTMPVFCRGWRVLDSTFLVGGICCGSMDDFTLHPVGGWLGLYLGFWMGGEDG